MNIGDYIRFKNQGGKLDGWTGRIQKLGPGKWCFAEVTILLDEMYAGYVEWECLLSRIEIISFEEWKRIRLAYHLDKKVRGF